MIRIIPLAVALTVGIAMPAYAVDTSQKTPEMKTETGPATKGNLFTEEQARVHLSQLGYTSISELKKNQNGVWEGSATKDGKTRLVAVDIKGAVQTK